MSALAMIVLCEALAAASTSTLPVPVSKNSRLLGPVKVLIERAGTTGGGTVYGAYLPGPNNSSNYYQPLIGDGSTTAFATQIPYAALSNNNFLVRASLSGRTGTAAVTAASATVTGTGTAFTTELRIGDEIRINGELRRVLSIASDTSLTVSRAFAASASGATVYMVDGFLAPTTDFTVSNVGGLATITVGAAGKAPNGATLEVFFVTPVAAFTFATATTTFAKRELPTGFDVAWFVSDSTATPSATNVYLEALGQ